MGKAQKLSILFFHLAGNFKVDGFCHPLTNHSKL